MVMYYFYNIIIASFGIFIFLLPAVLKYFDSSVDIHDNDVFNYIIVGGGSSGSIIASRLSLNPKITILVLESGFSKPNFLNIPSLGPLFQLSSFDWQYVTVPQEHSCFAFKENRSRWPTGRLLGGTSHLNYMLYVPGHINDYDSWKSQITKDWGADDIRFYFKKSQGSFPLREVPYSTHFSNTVLEAAKELGFQLIQLGLDTLSGFSKPLVNIDEWGRRWTFDQLLYPAPGRPNLVVKTGVTVRKVLVNDAMTAIGVEIEMGGKLINVLASREVLISAGAVGSPQILMLSGIGPPNVLQSSQIILKKKLPVGANLQDHVTTGLDLFTSKKHIFSIGDLVSLKSAYDYYVHGAGPFTSALCEAVGIINGTRDHPPEIELMVMMAGLSSDGGLFSRHTLGITEEVWESYFARLVGKNVATILPVLLHPKSSGNIMLNSSNPNGPPIINPRYLSHSDDVETLVDGLQLVYKLATTSVMWAAGMRLNRRPFPGCHGYVFGQRDYWRCYVRQLTLTSYHPVGTCRMGHAPSDSVVDHHLRVHGVRNLRVADASIMPSLPSGNTQASVAMIAEKAADLILSTYHEDNYFCDLYNIFRCPSICVLS